MTRELRVFAKNRIEYLLKISSFVFDERDREALEMAIQALSQEPCDDAVSRQAVLDIDFKKIILTTAKPAEMIAQKVRALPPVDWSVQEFADRCRECGARYGKLLKQKSGHWISHYDEDEKVGWYECDRCHTERAFNTRFCPDCGAKMVEPQERNDKEMNIQVINAGNCIICGREIKIVTKRGGNKFPNIFFCPRCERRVNKEKKKVESEEKNENNTSTG